MGAHTQEQPGGQALWAAVLLPDAHRVPLPLRSSLTLLVTVEQTLQSWLGRINIFLPFLFPNIIKRK